MRARRRVCPKSTPRSTRCSSATSSTTSSIRPSTRKWMPHARAVLDELRDYRLAIVTNKPRETTDAVLDRLGVRSLFSAVVARGRFAGASSPRRSRSSTSPSSSASSRASSSWWATVRKTSKRGGAPAAAPSACEGGFLPPERLVASQPDVLIDSLARASGTSCRAGATRRSERSRATFGTGCTVTSRRRDL